jgi:hypothetical protein
MSVAIAYRAFAWGATMSDLTDIVVMMRKVDAFHDPAEANALLTAGALEICRLRSLLPGPPPMGPYWHPGDEA